MNRWTVLLATLLFGAMLALGCSGNGGSPVTPSADTGLTVGTPRNGAGVQTHLWGYWDIHIDVETQTVDIVANRTAQFAANVTTFLNSNGGLAFDIIETPVESEWIDVDINVTLTHPLPGLPQYDGYDVKGVFMGQASAALDYNSALEYGVFGVDQVMLDDPDDADGGGADGYTRWFNAPEFMIPGVLGYTHGNFAAKNYTPTSTLNPYKYFADGLGPYDDLWEWLGGNADTNGVFSSGSTNTRNYYLRFPNSTNVNYGYAVVASWKGEETTDHPAPAPETPGIRVTQDDIVYPYYVDETNNGGVLSLDIDVWNWTGNGQPSTIYVESDVIGGVFSLVDVYDGPPVTENYSTYEGDFVCTNVTGTEGNTFWVICEYPDYDYSNEYEVPNDAQGDPLAAFFMFDMYVSPEQPCDAIDVVAIDPVSGVEGNIINATITMSGGFTDVGGMLDAELVLDTEVIPGDNVTYVDTTTLTADFDLTDATASAEWDVHVVNGCGTEATGVDMFEVIEPAGLYIEDSGDLPDPQPYADNVHFSVVGPTTMGFNGVYYFGNNYQLLKYPLDYSADGALYMTLNGYPGYPASTWFGTPNQVGVVEVDASGGVICTSYGTNILFSVYRQDQCFSWWQANVSNSSNALVLNSLYGTVHTRDAEAEFSAFGVLWGNYRTDADFNYAGNDVEEVMIGVGYPYGSSNYTTGWSINWCPLDETGPGSLDGEVSNVEQYKLAIDSDPHGNTPGYNIIMYYLEGAPDDPTIEVFENIKSSLGSADSLYATLDETYFAATPVDICVVNGYNILDDGNAESNWLVVLEDYGDSTWGIEVFEPDGTLADSYYDDTLCLGDQIGMDVDQANQKIHVWADVGGTYTYYILTWP